MNAAWAGGHKDTKVVQLLWAEASCISAKKQIYARHGLGGRQFQGGPSILAIRQACLKQVEGFLLSNSGVQAQWEPGARSKLRGSI